MGDLQRRPLVLMWRQIEVCILGSLGRGEYPPPPSLGYFGDKWYGCNGLAAWCVAKILHPWELRVKYLFCFSYGCFLILDWLCADLV